MLGTQEAGYSRGGDFIECLHLHGSILRCGSDIRHENSLALVRLQRPLLA